MENFNEQIVEEVLEGGSTVVVDVVEESVKKGFKPTVKGSIITGVVVGAIGAGVGYFLKRRKDKKEQENVAELEKLMHEREEKRIQEEEPKMENN